MIDQMIQGWVLGVRLLLAVLGSFAVGLIITPLVRAAARRFQIVAAPREDRWHRKPTALLGGIAIYASFIAGYWILAPKAAHVGPILLGGSLLFAIGLLDDLIQIKPHSKLIAQLIGAAVVVQFGLRLPWTANDAINSCITIFWLVGITNAINLLDNMDGLAAGISGIASIFLTITFLLNGQVAEAFIPALLGGVVLSFLVFNFKPASIFMGDSGSMFLGFMLSATALLSGDGRMRDLSSVLLAPVLIMMIPIFDTCVVIVSRKLHGLSVARGGCDHTSHRLVALGMSERRAVLMFYGFAVLSGLLSLMVRLLQPTAILVLVPTFALLVLLLGIQLMGVKVYESKTPQGSHPLVYTLGTFSYKRRIIEVSLDMLLVVLAYYGAYLVYYHGIATHDRMVEFVETLPVVLAVQVACLWLGGVYRGEWHYAGPKDILVIARSAVAGAIGSALLLWFVKNTRSPSLEVVMANSALLLIFVAASRLSFRVLRNLILDRKDGNVRTNPSLASGSGNGGEWMFQDIILRTAVGLGFVLILATFFSFSSLAAPQTGTKSSSPAGVAERKPAVIAGTIQGSGQISVNGHVAVTGTTVLSGSSIKTGADGHAIVDLAVLGHVTVMPNSSIELAVESNRVRVDLISGSVIQSLAAGASGELGLPAGKTGLSVEKGRLDLASGSLLLKTGDQRLVSNPGHAVLAGGSVVKASVGGSVGPLTTAGRTSGSGKKAPSRTLPGLASEGATEAFRTVTAQPPEASAEITAQPGNPRRPPASPIRP